MQHASFSLKLLPHPVPVLMQQTWEKLKDELVGNDPEARALLDEDRDRTRDAHFQHLGAIVMEQVCVLRDEGWETGSQDWTVIDCSVEG